jgi:carbon-monoxide dehydrogenase small subunit
MSTHTLSLTVNGEVLEATVPARRLLADFLRDDLGLPGTKRGCETGICGACSVLVDGKVVKSCLSLAVQARGKAITTIEGLSQGDTLHPVQASFMRCGGLQCGYCTPGMVMATCSMLNDNPCPTVDEVRHGLGGNLCRCTGYAQIVESVLDAAEKASEKIHGN